jgi:hypothetical protein
MRSLIWTNAVLGLILLAVAAASHMYSEGRFLVSNPPALSQKIGEIQDIEHLRKLALLLVRGNDEAAVNTNRMIVSGIRAFEALSLFCAIFFVANCLSLIKHSREAEGRPSKWLRWL